MKLLRKMVLTLLLVSTCALGQVVDQDNTIEITTELDVQRTGVRWHQEVQVGLGGVLTGIELFAGADPGSFVLSVNRGRGWQDDADDYSVAVIPSGDSTVFIDLAVADLRFNEDDYFVIGLTGSGTAEPRYGLKGTPASSYGPGRLFINVIEPLEYRFDLAFKTYVTAVPEPGATVMLAFGLGVLGLAARVVGKSRCGNPAAARGA